MAGCHGSNQNHHVLSLFSLETIIHQDSKLYLVFEFMQMDLKKFLDNLPTGKLIDTMLLKVVIFSVLAL